MDLLGNGFGQRHHARLVELINSAFNVEYILLGLKWRILRRSNSPRRKPQQKSKINANRMVAERNGLAWDGGSSLAVANMRAISADETKRGV